ncbi:MAG TPA: hypothetical protein P5076_22730, partial [Myxococcota bacterium]|nr:hypothetical protein [Myxococcota bacterium]
GKLLAGDLAGARQLLAEPLRATTTEPELSAFLAAGGQELRALLAQVARGGLEVVSFRVRLPGGGEAEIRPEQGGELRLAGGALCPAPQGSPAVALLAFARALEAQDCAALLTTAPPATLARLGRDRLMEGCRARLERSRDLVQPLREAVARLPAPTGDRLTLALEPAGKLVLVRQDGRWFVEDLDAPAAAGQGGGNP